MLADWLLNDQGCECEDAGECNICLIVKALRDHAKLAADVEALRAECKAWRHRQTVLAGQDRIVRSDRTNRDGTALKVAADLADKAESMLTAARAATDAARGGEA